MMFNLSHNTVRSKRPYARKLIEKYQQVALANGYTVENSTGALRELQSKRESILRKASLILLPLAYKPGYLLALDGDGNGVDIPFSRPGNRTRVNAQGIIEELGDNVPGIDYSGGEAKLTSEIAKTSRVDNINYVNGWGFGIPGTFELRIGEGYGGTNEAVCTQTITKNNTGFRLGIQVEAGINTLSFFLRKGDDFELLEFFLGPNEGVTRLNATTGLWTSLDSNVVDSWVNDRGEFWHFILVRDFGASSSYNIDFDPISTGGTFHLSGVQLHPGRYPTSLILSAGGAVTRNTEICALSGIENLLGSDAGTMYADYYLDFNDPDGSFQPPVYLSNNGAIDDRAYYYHQSTMGGRFIAFLGESSANIFTLIDPTKIVGRHKAVMGWENANQYANIDGDSQSGNSVLSNLSLSRVGILGNQHGVSQGGTSLNMLMLFPTMLSNAEIDLLAT